MWLSNFPVERDLGIVTVLPSTVQPAVQGGLTQYGYLNTRLGLISAEKRS